jgi:hypothetical protein
MLTPLFPLDAPHRDVCTQGNKSVRVGLPLRRTPYRRRQVKLSTARTRRPRTAGRGKLKAGPLLEGEDSEFTRLDDYSDCTLRTDQTTYAKGRIFVCQVATFAVLELGKGLTVNNPMDNWQNEELEFWSLANLVASLRDPRIRLAHTSTSRPWQWPGQSARSLRHL